MLTARLGPEFEPYCESPAYRSPLEAGNPPLTLCPMALKYHKPLSSLRHFSPQVNNRVGSKAAVCHSGAWNLLSWG